MNKFQMEGKTVKWAAGGVVGMTEPQREGAKHQISIHPFGRSDKHRSDQRRRRITGPTNATPSGTVKPSQIKK